VLNKQKIEDFLVLNWNKLLPIQDLKSYIIKTISEQEDKIIESSEPTQEKNLISVSRFEILYKKFLIWIEFNMPYKNSIISGTIEVAFNHEGDIIECNLVGSKHPIGTK
jgi:hypothetical protein